MAVMIFRESPQYEKNVQELRSTNQDSLEMFACNALWPLHIIAELLPAVRVRSSTCSKTAAVAYFNMIEEVA